MVKIRRFPLEGTAYEQADFCVKQIGYMLDQRRFGRISRNEALYEEYEGIRKDCVAILRAIETREKFRNEKPVGEEDGEEKALLATAQRLIDEQEREDGTAGGFDGTREDAGNGPENGAENSDAGIESESGGGLEEAAQPAAEGADSTAERFIDLETLGADAAGNGGDV